MNSNLTTEEILYVAEVKAFVQTGFAACLFRNSRKLQLNILVALGAATFASAQETPLKGELPLWRDWKQPVAVRTGDLIGRMSLKEKAAQVCNQAPAIRRLGLPAYNYWNECLHGLARNGTATVFPQSIGLAATWDSTLLYQIGDTIATEARAKHREYAERHDGDSDIYTGLSFWSPNINIFRDPRWGRGQETYGEDPFLTGRMAVAFIRGLQGEDPKYYKALACVKHFAVHSGPEAERHRFDAQPTERDFYETYLPHFEMAVREGRVGAVMGAYNSVYGEPACCNSRLLNDILRQQWGFRGHVVSDCGAINDIFAFHKYAGSTYEAAAFALRAGCDLCCGGDYDGLTRAVSERLVTESEIDQALGRLLEARFRLGLFDPPAQVPYAQIPVTECDTPKHAALALRAARESVVLLKNDGLLPLNRSRLRRMVVIGTNAQALPVLLGNYNGTPSHPITILEGIRKLAGTNVEVVFDPGCPLALRQDDTNSSARAGEIARAVAAAASADVVLYVGGISPELEGEDLKVPYLGFFGGDRTRIELPEVQTEFLKALHATGKPVIFVNCSGSAIAMPWAATALSAIVQAWYPGQAGGQAVAEVLFGEVNPAGRLPITFYAASEDLPGFTDYAMSNRTYRFFSGKPLFAFGHGLSYTQFRYEFVQVDREQAHANDTVRISLRLSNTGTRDGEEVVQVYSRYSECAVGQPRQALCGFQRVAVRRGRTEEVGIEVPIARLRSWNSAAKQYTVEPGDYELLVGGAADDIRASLALRVMEPKEPLAMEAAAHRAAAGSAAEKETETP
jgi:beta-glucosidase